MNEAVQELTGDQAKMIALQFLGQNLGEMKELDRNIVTGLKPVAGSVDPHAMLNSIAPPAPTQLPVQQTYTQQHAPIIPVSQPVAETQQVDPNQLELNFNTSPYTERVFDKLESLERKLTSLQETQSEILTALSDIKKKSETLRI